MQETVSRSILMSFWGAVTKGGAEARRHPERMLQSSDILALMDRDSRWMVDREV